MLNSGVVVVVGGGVWVWVWGWGWGWGWGWDGAWVWGVEVDAINDTVAGLFSFFMHLVVVICSSISHMIARLLVVSSVFEAVEDVVFEKQFCS